MAKTTAKKEKPAYKIQQKRSGRYAVIGKDGKYINGPEKVEILQKEGKLKKLKPKAKAEAPAEESTEA
ncbi:MAG: hypothetical protein M0R76_11150 [Proteobacteria bacterium]|nr:hypothetical protein [Pseudomonadota bacterium]